MAKRPGVVPRTKATDAKHTGRVVPVEPLVLGQTDAAAFLGKSVSWLMEKRNLDLALIRAGEPTRGPRWYEWNGTPVYRASDLAKWFDAHAVERGQVHFRGNPTPDKSDAPAAAGA